MKIENIIKNYSGAVSYKKTVEFSVSPNELVELCAALKVLNKYKKLAFNGLKFKPKHADWYMIDYEITDNKEKVLFKFEAGSCG